MVDFVLFVLQLAILFALIWYFCVLVTIIIQAASMNWNFFEKKTEAENIAIR